MIEISKELATLNNNVALLLEKYDGAFKDLNIEKDEAIKQLQALITGAVGNAKKLENKTLQQVIQEAKTNVNATMLNGLTLEDIKALIFPPPPPSTINIVDLFGDNSGKTLIPLRNNSNDLAGIYNGVDGGGVIYDGRCASILNSRIQFHSNIMPDDNTQDFTFSIMLRKNTSSGEIFFVKAIKGNDYFLALYINLLLLTRSTSSYSILTDLQSVSLSAGKFFNFMLVAKGNQWDYYIDNKFIFTDTTPYTSRSYHSFALGNHTSDIGNYDSNSSQAQLRVFNKGLNENERAKVFAEKGALKL